MGHRSHLTAPYFHVQVRQLQEQMLALQQAKEQSDAALNDHAEALEQLQQDCTNWQQQAQAASQRAEEQAAAAADKLRQGQRLQVQLCYRSSCWLCMVEWQRCDRGSTCIDRQQYMQAAGAEEHVASAAGRQQQVQHLEVRAPCGWVQGMP